MAKREEFDRNHAFYFDVDVTSGEGFEGNKSFVFVSNTSPTKSLVEQLLNQQELGRARYVERIILRPGEKYRCPDKIYVGMRKMTGRRINWPSTRDTFDFLVDIGDQGVLFSKDVARDLHPHYLTSHSSHKKVAFTHWVNQHGFLVPVFSSVEEAGDFYCGRY